MQISTKISTQIVLSQDELKTAAIEFIKTRTEVPADATFEVDFADDTADTNLLTAIIDITGTIAAVTSAEKPARKPRADKSKPAEEPNVATTVTEANVNTTTMSEVLEAAGVTVGEEEKPNISTSPEDRQDPADSKPPFEIDPPDFSATKKAGIFGQTETSAPVIPNPEPEVDPATKAKSLFANLSKPTA